MMTHDTLPADVLDRYLAGDCLPEERQMVEAWMAADPERRTFHLETLRNHGARQWDSAQALATVFARGDAISQKSVGARISTKRRTPQWVWGSAAAVVVAAAALLVAPGLRDTLASLTNKPATTYVEHSTARGERSRIPLPDGSVVVLAPESKIRYARSFSAQAARDVSLEGQALFTVTHSAGAPFVVRTGSVATTVLGTSFGVRRYASDSVVEVAVAQGKVGVAAGAGSPAVLGTGDIARVSDALNVTVSRGNVITPYLAWAEGPLHFTGQRFGDAVADLERWYGVQVVVADSVLLGRGLVTTLGPESFREAMELVALSLGARVVIDGRQVTFRLSTTRGSL